MNNFHVLCGSEIGCHAGAFGIRRVEVNFNLTDAMGKTVLIRTFALQGEGTNGINIEGLSLPKGIYFYTLRANTGSAAGRILKTED